MIQDFKQKKLVEYLKDGQKVLIRFGHGLGDTILFMPIFEKLKSLYPTVHFDLYIESGQEEIWSSIKNKDAPGYDLVFSLNFPMSEGGIHTKPEKCCIDEIGIQPITDTAKLPKKDSPIVAVHFQGTALPGSVSCPALIAYQIWEEIKDCNKIPVETHYQHVFHNPANRKYSFINVTARDLKASLSSLFGLIQHSCAFIGIASGPFVVALASIPDRTLYLEKAHKLKTYSTKQIATVDINNYQSGGVKKWLQSLPGS
ncbi:hypothetical protein KAW50_02700 [candidate division WOR-3 bacterium]|nr:hypothetical protein [candidate division WOR-3 bacterium]